MLMCCRLTCVLTRYLLSAEQSSLPVFVSFARRSMATWYLHNLSISFNRPLGGKRYTWCDLDHGIWKAF